jgi:tRNA threonylcarbamoyladenosine biosynthesis protein TsaB
LKILAFDIGSNYSSIALHDDGNINSFTVPASPRQRPDWNYLFSKLELTPNQILNSLDGLSYANGPGSYTALRSTAVFLKAIAFTKNIPIFPISNLEALAWQAKDWMDSLPVEINVALNADQGKFYQGSYRLSSQNIETVSSPQICFSEELEKIAKKEKVLVGEGWLSLSDKVNLLKSVQANASSVASLALHYINQGNQFDNIEVDPIYLSETTFKKLNS